MLSIIAISELSCYTCKKEIQDNIVVKLIIYEVLWQIRICRNCCFFRLILSPKIVNTKKYCEQLCLSHFSPWYNLKCFLSLPMIWIHVAQCTSVHCIQSMHSEYWMHSVYWKQCIVPGIRLVTSLADAFMDALLQLLWESVNSEHCL